MIEINRHCSRCRQLIRATARHRVLRFVRSSTSSSRLHLRLRHYIRPLGATLLVLPPFLFFWRSSTPPHISPGTYSDHPCSSAERISPQHVLVSIPIPAASLALFDDRGAEGATSTAGEKVETVTIHHLMVKNPDLQIERPYTPINDVGKDGELKLVVKRVKGGEVGR